MENTKTVLEIYEYTKIAKQNLSNEEFGLFSIRTEKDSYIVSNGTYFNIKKNNIIYSIDIEKEITYVYGRLPFCKTRRLLDQETCKDLKPILEEKIPLDRIPTFIYQSVKQKKIK